MAESDLLAVGKVAKSHGVKGDIKVVPFSGVPQDLLNFNDIFIGSGPEIERYKVDKSRIQGKFTLFKLAGVEGRSVADQLVGLKLWVAKESLPVLVQDEFYWHELEGLEVKTTEGRSLGRVATLMATGASDVLVVRGRGQEYLIPAINEVIVSIDYEAGVVVISPMPGLLEINES